MTAQHIGPGEANTRRRRRMQLYYYAVGMLLGAAMGVLLAMTESGEGNFFSRDFTGLSLDPAIAIGMCAFILLGFLLVPLWGFTRIDELLREQNLIGFTGGALAVINGYPVWLMLHAGGFVEEPHAYGLFLLALAGTVVSFLFAKLRDSLPF